jgi:(+)-trans-carveol dehydrogenase
MSILDGKVAVISGAARGQGRAHALRLAAAGARLIAFDICDQIPTVPYAMGGEDDLATTKVLVEKAAGQILAMKADVRVAAEVDAVVTAGLERFGRIDIVVANAGIGHPFAPCWTVDDDAFVNTVQVNLVGAWRTAKAAVPQLVEQGTGGSIVITGSGASIKGLPNLIGYVAAKHGVLGLVRAMARELGRYDIRVNAVLPGNTRTPMFDNDAMKRLMIPDIDEPSDELFAERARAGSPMGRPWVDPEDVAEAVVWLASPASRFVTGTALPVDGGSGIP